VDLRNGPHERKCKGELKYPLIHDARLEAGPASRYFIASYLCESFNGALVQASETASWLNDPVAKASI
jgi:hypothetical protein